MNKLTAILSVSVLTVAASSAMTASPTENHLATKSSQGPIFLPGHYVNFGHVDSLTAHQDWPYGLNAISTKFTRELECKDLGAFPCDSLYECNPRHGYWTFRYYTTMSPMHMMDTQIDRDIDVYFEIVDPPIGENAAIEGVDFTVCTSSCDPSGLPGPVALGNGQYRIRVPDSGTPNGASGNNIWIDFIDDGDGEEPEAFLIRLLRAEIVGTNYEVEMGSNNEARWLIVDAN